ncbi:MAG: hypothetical protein FJX77_14495, partial [Armatimonadetes bacterium]|nr:hypothetical protein [Armatimonadota bacterium]
MVPAAIRAALGIPGRPVPTADPTTSELLRLYGDQLLTLAGFPPRGPVQSLQSKLAQTTRVPDGLLQVDPTEPGARP